MDQHDSKLQPTHYCLGYRNWSLIYFSPCQVDRSQIDYNRGDIRSSAIQLRAVCVHFFGGWQVTGMELLSEPYHLECS